MDNVLKQKLEAILGKSQTASGNIVQHLALVYTSLSCGGAIDTSEALAASKKILGLSFTGNEQAARSIFQYTKWGTLSCLLPKLTESPSFCESNAPFIDDIFDNAADAVESVPMNALVPLFNCLVTAAKSRFSGSDSKIVGNDVEHLDKIIKALFGLFDEAENSNDAMYFLDETCALIFQPALLLDEHMRLQVDPDCLTPIRDAFRRLIKAAGTQRPHISRVVLSRICAGWLGGTNAETGLSAIPYRYASLTY